MTRPAAWSDDENDSIAATYLHMLSLELLGTKFNKSAHRRSVLSLLNNRSAGSYEMKCCNISAVMRSAQLPWINGYKPLGHGQQKALAAALARTMIIGGWNDADIAALETLAKVTT